jgi:predicted Zn-dependent protease
VLLLLAAALAAAPAPPPAPPPPVGHVAAEAAMAEARSARERGDAAAEQVELARAVGADPGWDLPRLDLAELILREEGNGRAALELLPGPAQRPDNPRLPRLRGAALEQLGDDAGAAAAYAEALAVREDGELRLRRALLLARTGASAEAIAELERLRAARPRDPLPRSHLAELYEAAGRRAEAEAELRWLGAASPADPAPLRRLARFLSRGGDAARAAAAEQAARALEKPVRAMRPLMPDGRRR